MLSLHDGLAFHRVWVREAEVNNCDALVGAEYRRVRQQWMSSGCPRPIRLFIFECVNLPPEGTGTHHRN